jgi:hypothetical protein
VLRSPQFKKTPTPPSISPFVNNGSNSHRPMSETSPQPSRILQVFNPQNEHRIWPTITMKNSARPTTPQLVSNYPEQISKLTWWKQGVSGRTSNALWPGASTGDWKRERRSLRFSLCGMRSFQSLESKRWDPSWDIAPSVNSQECGLAALLGPFLRVGRMLRAPHAKRHYTRRGAGIKGPSSIHNLPNRVKGKGLRGNHPSIA